MPFTIKGEQEKFKFKVNDEGLPLGKVIKLGDNYWISCCPLCGHTHDLGKQQEGEFEPNCIVKVLQPKVYADWIKQYPEAAHSTRVVLVAAAEK
jgi:hypothetical protein